jgi:hypothetical protein
MAQPRNVTTALQHFGDMVKFLARLAGEEETKGENHADAARFLPLVGG